MRSISILTAFTLMAALFGCDSGNKKAVQDELVGVWKTSAPKYADRFFALGKDTITFGTGPGTASVYDIVKVEKVRADKQILYTIHYVTEGSGHSEFSFYYEPANGGTIRFKNQKEMEWRRTPPRRQ